VSVPSYIDAHGIGDSSNLGPTLNGSKQTHTSFQSAPAHQRATFAQPFISDRIQGREEDETMRIGSKLNYRQFGTFTNEIRKRETKQEEKHSAKLSALL